MTTATVRIPTPLRGYTRGADRVDVPGATVREILAALERDHAGIAARVLDERGEVRAFVNVFVGEQNIKSLRGLDTPVLDGAVLSIVPAVAGGAR